MRLASLSLLLLVLAFAIPAHASDITVTWVCDDCSRYTAAVYRTAGIDTVTAGVGTPATPNLDAMAAAGSRFDKMHATPLCSHTRASIITGALTSRPENLHGFVNNGDSTAGVIEVKPSAPNLFNSIKGAGTATALFGKWHLGNTEPRDEFDGQTMLTAMGIDHSDVVIQSNPDKVVPMSDAEYTTATGFATNCAGHYSTVRTDSAGVPYVTSTYSMDVEVDAAEAYIAAWRISNPGDPLFVWLATSAPHNPLRDGTGGESCAGGNPADDRPPAPNNTGSGADEVYADKIRHLDLRVGTMRALLNLDTTDRLIFVADNGTQNGRLLPPEIPLSSGAKNTVFPFGVFVPAIFEGHDIEVGVVSGLQHVVDLSATIVSLMGGRAIHRDGTSFAACLTESFGLTAATCPARPFVVDSRWRPLGGVAGTIERRPLPSDGAGIWTTPEDWIYTTTPDDTLRLLARFRDGDDAALAYREEFWEVPLSGVNMYLPPATYSPLADNLAGENDLDAADFTITATADELTALASGHAQLDGLLNRDGDTVPSRVGASQ